MEIWKDIKGFEGLYQISSLGRIKSLPRGTKKERIRIPRAANNGYLYVVLSKNNVPTTVRIHRLVAETFIPKPSQCDTVNHKNLDKQDNTVENLEWLSCKDNIHHAFENGVGNQRQVRQIKNGITVNVWKNISEASRNGYIGTLISKCCLGKQKTHRGYKWEYV